MDTVYFNEGMSIEEVRKLAKGHEIDISKEDAEMLVRVTGGHPHFLKDLLRRWQDIVKSKGLLSVFFILFRTHLLQQNKTDKEGEVVPCFLRVIS